MFPMPVHFVDYCACESGFEAAGDESTLRIRTTDSFVNDLNRLISSQSSSCILVFASNLLGRLLCSRCRRRALR